MIATSGTLHHFFFYQNNFRSMPRNQAMRWPSQNDSWQYMREWYCVCAWLRNQVYSVTATLLSLFVSFLGCNPSGTNAMMWTTSRWFAIHSKHERDHQRTSFDTKQWAHLTCSTISRSDAALDQSITVPKVGQWGITKDFVRATCDAVIILCESIGVSLDKSPGAYPRARIYISL